MIINIEYNSTQQANNNNRSRGINQTENNGRVKNVNILQRQQSSHWQQSQKIKLERIKSITPIGLVLKNPKNFKEFKSPIQFSPRIINELIKNQRELQPQTTHKIPKHHSNISQVENKQPLSECLIPYIASFRKSGFYQFNIRGRNSCKTLQPQTPSQILMTKPENMMAGTSTSRMMATTLHSDFNSINKQRLNNAFNNDEVKELLRLEQKLGRLQIQVEKEKYNVIQQAATHQTFRPYFKTDPNIQQLDPPVLCKSEIKRKQIKYLKELKQQNERQNERQNEQQGKNEKSIQVQIINNQFDLGSWDQEHFEDSINF